MATSTLRKKKADDLKSDDSKGVTATKALNSEWRVNLGEHVLDIRVGKYSLGVRSNSFDVIVLGKLYMYQLYYQNLNIHSCIGEFSLYCIKPSGEICFQKRLGIHPSSCCLYHRSHGTSHFYF